MNTKPYIKGLQSFLAFILVVLVSAGCNGNISKTTKPETSKPPQIPPQSTFVMDFSDFIQNGTSSLPDYSPEVLMVSIFQETTPAIASGNALGDRSNWSFAALNVGFWNLVGLVGLAIPVASFAASVNQAPVKQPDNSWVWTYSITVQEITYTSELHGKYIASGIRWEMYISKQNEYTDFLWYYGESDLEGTRGYWILKEKPSRLDDLLRIDWNRNPTTQTSDIKYTNIVTGGPENGGYISFIVSKDEHYNRAYTIYSKGKNETTYIEWNYTSKIGRVKDQIHFSDTSWHYWDSSLKNTTGP
jgi:hypothetical protein